jgi:hypothetical protein
LRSNNHNVQFAEIGTLPQSGIVAVASRQPLSSVVTVKNFMSPCLSIGQSPLNLLQSPQFSKTMLCF